LFDTEDEEQYYNISKQNSTWHSRKFISRVCRSHINGSDYTCVSRYSATMKRHAFARKSEGSPSSGYIFGVNSRVRVESLVAVLLLCQF
jgi:hypothetical protein